MKTVQKLFLYLLSAIALVIFSIYTFHFHPEVQFVFLLPGIFIIIYSAVLNILPSRARMIKGK